MGLASFFLTMVNDFADSNLIVVLRKKNVTVMFMDTARSRLDTHTIPCKMNGDMSILFCPIGSSSR